MTQELRDSHENDPIPRILFTGTNLEYVQKTIQKYGYYRQETSRPTYLSPNLGIAFDAAINRSHTYKGTPIVIVVDSQTEGVNPRWNTRIGFKDDILSDAIPTKAILEIYKVELTKRTEIMFANDPIQTLRDNFGRVEL